MDTEGELMDTEGQLMDTEGQLWDTEGQLWIYSLFWKVGSVPRVSHHLAVHHPNLQGDSEGRSVKFARGGQIFATLAPPKLMLCKIYNLISLIKNV